MSTVRKSQATSMMTGAGNSAQVEPARLGDGSTPWRRTMAQTLEGASRIRIVASSPWILRYLQVGFSLAN